MLIEILGLTLKRIENCIGGQVIIFYEYLNQL